MVIFILIFIVCLELSFACKDASRLSNFKKQQPTKKETLRYLGFGLLRATVFLLAAALASLVFSLIPSFYYWSGRSKELIEALRPELNSDFPYIFRIFIFIFLFPVSVIFAAILVIKKIRIALSIIFPMIVIFGFLFIAGLDFSSHHLKYYKNPLADTKVSESFKPLNLPLLKEGMAKEEVLNLLGEPLSQSESCFYYTEENGKGWYDYFILKVYFENDAVVKIRKDWGYED